MGTKKCKKCELERFVCDFYNSKSHKSGKNTICKFCCQIRNQEYLKNNLEKNRIRGRKYYKDNEEKIKKIKKIQYDNNLEKNRNRGREYYKKNHEKCLEYRKNRVEIKKEYDRLYRIKNSVKIKNYKKKYSEENKHKINEYYVKRRKHDILFKISHTVRNRIYELFKNKNITKNKKSLELIGCSYNVLKEHLEKQFVDGMNWDNHGQFGWHIDHKKPLASATNEEELYKLCHYTNLQPLWWWDNLEKNKKIN